MRTLNWTSTLSFSNHTTRTSATCETTAGGGSYFPADAKQQQLRAWSLLLSRSCLPSNVSTLSDHQRVDITNTPSCPCCQGQSPMGQQPTNPGTSHDGNAHRICSNLRMHEPGRAKVYMARQVAVSHSGTSVATAEESPITNRVSFHADTPDDSPYRECNRISLSQRLCAARSSEQ